MSKKSVIVHDCMHSDMDDGLLLRCGCRTHVTRKQAKEMVASGAAIFRRTSQGIEDCRQILLRERSPRLRHATTINQHQIIRAIDDAEERERVEAYNEINQAFLLHPKPIEVRSDVVIVDENFWLRRSRLNISPASHIVDAPYEGPVITVWTDLRTNYEVVAE